MLEYDTHSATAVYGGEFAAVSLPNTLQGALLLVDNIDWQYDVVHVSVRRSSVPPLSPLPRGVRLMSPRVETHIKASRGKRDWQAEHPTSYCIRAGCVNSPDRGRLYCADHEGVQQGCSRCAELEEGAQCAECREANEAALRYLETDVDELFGE